MNKKYLFVGILVLSVLPPIVANDNKDGFLDNLNLSEFDFDNYSNPKRMGVTISGVAALVGGLALRQHLGTTIPLHAKITDNVRPKDLAEAIAALGGIATVACGFKNGPRALARLLPEVGRAAVLEQLMNPGQTTDRYELTRIVGVATGLASLGNVGEWIGDIFRES